MIMAPTPMKTEHPDAGVLFETSELPSLSLSLYVIREQFSDMLPRFEARRFKHFHFTVEEKDAEGRWPVRSWGMGTTRPTTGNRTGMSYNAQQHSYEEIREAISIS